ncbi:LemA family protein [Gordonia rhizosphera]|uniref:LemA family protein n=1 Tax=Gordonia rhizosphera NBRC 16068 TaxID=1108045 RepID=K6X505_9ACTN|nr:LemA family protein [Gordonia rhizosphera]GAB93854.1 LemA family protein [Gordonia rhizosphera NBRC 16068]
MALIILIIVVVLVVALIGFGIVGFNKLRRADIAAQEALGGIDVQLTRRADLIPNLVNTVKGYATHEREVFEEVTAARAGLRQAAQGGSVEQKSAAEARLDGALGRLFAVAENYPDLKASANFTQLQSELSDTENKLSFARQFYNDAVARLNNLVHTIPWMFFTGWAGVKAREFYRAPEGHAEPPQVQF